MYHTYTICSLAEERSRGFGPHLKHCVVFWNMTLIILSSVLVSPRWSRRDIVCAPVCLSTCPSRNIPKYLLVRFDAFSASMDSTMDSPKCGSRGGGGTGGPDLPRKITSYIFSIGISNWNPQPRKKLDPPPPLENVGPPQDLEKW